MKLKESVRFAGAFENGGVLKKRALPIFESSDCMGIAIASAPDLDVVDALTHLLRRELRFLVADEEQQNEFIQTFYGLAGEGTGKRAL